MSVFCTWSSRRTSLSGCGSVSTLNFFVYIDVKFFIFFFCWNYFFHLSFPYSCKQVKSLQASPQDYSDDITRSMYYITIFFFVTFSRDYTLPGEAFVSSKFFLAISLDKNCHTFFILIALVLKNSQILFLFRDYFFRTLQCRQVKRARSKTFKKVLRIINEKKMKFSLF